jgi:hypothetical protein
VTSGSWIGIVVGVVSAFATYLYLIDAFRRPSPNPGWWERTFGVRTVSGAKTAGKIISLLTLWTGGKWLASGDISLNINWTTETEPYFEALALTYCFLVSPGLIRLIIRVWNEMEE